MRHICPATMTTFRTHQNNQLCQLQPITVIACNLPIYPRSLRSAEDIFDYRTPSCPTSRTSFFFSFLPLLSHCWSVIIEPSLPIQHTIYLIRFSIISRHSHLPHSSSSSITPPIICLCFNLCSTHPLVYGSSFVVSYSVCIA
jgi:hypothetical protein